MRESSHILAADIMAAYQAPDFEVMALSGVVLARIQTPLRPDIEQDTNLWLTFVRHRNGLAARGFRLTMPSFKEQSFEATIERMRRD